MEIDEALNKGVKTTQKLLSENSNQLFTKRFCHPIDHVSFQIKEIVKAYFPENTKYRLYKSWKTGKIIDVRFIFEADVIFEIVGDFFRGGVDSKVEQKYKSVQRTRLHIKLECDENADDFTKIEGLRLTGQISKQLFLPLPEPSEEGVYHIPQPGEKTKGAI